MDIAYAYMMGGRVGWRHGIEPDLPEECITSTAAAYIRLPRNGVAARTAAMFVVRSRGGGVTDPSWLFALSETFDLPVIYRGLECPKTHVAYSSASALTNALMERTLERHFCCVRVKDDRDVGVGLVAPDGHGVHADAISRVWEGLNLIERVVALRWAALRVTNSVVYPLDP